MQRSTRIRSIIGLLAFLAIVAAFIWMVSVKPYRPAQPAQAPPMPADTVAPPPAVHRDTGATVAAIPAAPDCTVTPVPIPPPDTATPPPLARNTAPPILPGPDSAVTPADITLLFPPGKLIIPVQGIRADQLQNTFDDARSEGRVHDAIDIMAPGGTPVLAAADGRIVKLFNSENGGTTIYQLDPNNRVIYYYAHLQRYADGLVEGHVARRGEVIAYVGDTGNAGPGNYHLHFEISLVPNPKQYWGGIPVNPYPILRGAPAH